MENNRITVWGDSVMKGVVYDEQRDKYTLLEHNSAENASRRLGLTLNNRSRMGCTVTKGMEILKRDLQAPLDCQAALIEFGGNDCDYNWEEVAARPDDDHEPKTPLALFTAQLYDMINTVRQHGIQPVMMSLPPIDAERYLTFLTRKGLSRDNILHWLGDVQHIYRWQERYNAAAMQIANECHCPVAAVREAFLNERNTFSLLCADGIHPNAKGHDLIEQVLEAFGCSLRSRRLSAV